MAESPASLASLARDGMANCGKPSPEKCRRLRSLLCGKGSGRMPGRSPRWKSLLCPPACETCSCTSPTLAIIGPLGAAWCVISARAMATVIRSCRNMERSRRSLRRRATPLDRGRPLGSAMNHGQLCKKRQRATCLSLVVVVVVVDIV